MECPALDHKKVDNLVLFINHYIWYCGHVYLTATKMDIFFSVALLPCWHCFHNSLMFGAGCAAL